jgi:hypothetical protein
MFRSFIRSTIALVWPVRSATLFVVAVAPFVVR